MSDAENQGPAGQDPEKPSGTQPGRPIQLGLFNVVVTIGLLVFGAVSVAKNLGDFIHPGEVVNQMLVSLHTQYPKFPVITYTATAFTAAVGAVLLTLQGANFGVITWWALTRLRASKPAFWIPVIGAFVCNALTFIALGLLIVSDQSIIDAMVAFAKASGN